MFKKINRTNVMPLNILDVPIEILIIVFSYCTIEELAALRLTCKSFKKTVDDWSGIFYHSDIIVTNLKHDCIKKRTRHMLNTFQKNRISYNWRIGKFGQKCYKYANKNCMPRLQLTKDCLWFSDNTVLRRFDRTNNDIIFKSSHDLSIPKKEINSFIATEKFVVTAHNGGSFCLWEWNTEKRFFKRNNFKVYNVDVNAIDELNHLIAIGNDNGQIALFNLKNIEEFSPIYENQLFNRIWCLKIMNKKLAVGSSGLDGPPISVIDLESEAIFHLMEANRHEVLDVKWENDNCLLTSGYDGNIYSYDMRDYRKPTFILEDPFNETIYSIDTDNNITIMSGTQHFGRVGLWDIRTLSYIQSYFMKTKFKKNTIRSPIYSLSFDASQLFAATDRLLHILDFSVVDGEIQDYSFATQIE